MAMLNTQESYGWMNRWLHWLSALWIFSLFGLGLWMVTLDYYSSWYHQAPELHKSMGFLLMLVLLFRWIWVLANPKPQLINVQQPWLKRAIRAIHRVFYVGFLSLGISGYLISTAEGHDLMVFDWLSIPSVVAFENQADWAGAFHQWMSYGLMALVAIHLLGALKHHFWDKDQTLKPMLS
ncbi:cytochrome b [Thiosulfativibrio zosterae]|uniref:Cytochrome b n=1 Tax=Thiosulfativibrio zosterae TaxID=2675053 RepID=A0A6F8PPP4_9GAMM|nr:cytochrome b [Thiosulfativibrio zosterae]BBP44014.1 cytochrome b [Thiosulfativibrio zosterae]